MPENSPFIAIVDDEPRMRAAALSRLLRASGYGVMSFEDGAALLAARTGDRHHWARPTRNAERLERLGARVYLTKPVKRYALRR